MSISFDPSKVGNPAPAAAPEQRRITFTPPPQASAPAKRAVTFTPPDTKGWDAAQQRIGQAGAALTNAAGAVVDAAVPGARQFSNAFAQTSGGKKVSGALEKVGLVMGQPGAVLGAISQDVAQGGNSIDAMRQGKFMPHVRDYLNQVGHGQLADALEHYYLLGRENLVAHASQGDPIAQFALKHPYGTMTVDALAEWYLNPMNGVPGALGRLAKSATAAKAAKTVADHVSQHNPYTAPVYQQLAPLVKQHVAPAVAAASDKFKRTFVSPYVDLDRMAKDDQAKAQAHALGRGLRHNPNHADFLARRELDQIYGKNARAEDILPAKLLYQQRAHRTFVQQQPAEIQAAARGLIADWKAARAAMRPDQIRQHPSEAFLGETTVQDAPQAFVDAQLGQFEDPKVRQHIWNVAQSIERGSFGPQKLDPNFRLTPDVERMAQAHAQRYGRITAMTKNAAPDLVPHEQIGFMSKRGIYDFDEGAGVDAGDRQSGGAVISENKHRATYPTLYEAIMAHKAGRLEAAPYSRMSPQEADSAFFKKRYTNLLNRKDLSRAANIQTNAAPELVREAKLSSTTDLPALFRPRYQTPDGAIVDGKTFARAKQEDLEKRAWEDAAKDQMLDKPPSSKAGPNLSRAAAVERMARTKKNEAVNLARNAETTAERARERMSDFEVNDVKDQMRTGQEVKRAAQAGEAGAERAAERGRGEVGKFRERMDRTSERQYQDAEPMYERAKQLETTIEAHPYNAVKRERKAAGEQLTRTKAALTQAKAALDEAGIEPGKAVQEEHVTSIARSMAQDERARQAPYWDALDAVGGKLRPDLVWDGKRWIRAGEFDDVPDHLLEGHDLGTKRAAQGNRINGNLDEIAQHVRDATGQDVSTSDITDFFARHPTRRVTIRGYMDDAREAYKGLRGRDVDDALKGYRSAQAEHAQARATTRDLAEKQRATPPLDHDVEKAAQGLTRSVKTFAVKKLPTRDAERHTALEKLEQAGAKTVEQIKDAYGKASGMQFHILSNADLRRSRALAAYRKVREGELRHFVGTLARFGARATQGADRALILRQLARADAVTMRKLNSAYKAALERLEALPSEYEQPDFKGAFVPVTTVPIGGRHLGLPDPDGLYIAREIPEYLRSVGAPGEIATDMGRAISFWNWLARTSFVQNPAIHTIWNEVFMHALRTGDFTVLRDLPAIVSDIVAPTTKLVHKDVGVGLQGYADDYLERRLAKLAPYDRLAFIHNAHRPFTPRANGLFERHAVKPKYDGPGKQIVGYIGDRADRINAKLAAESGPEVETLGYDQLSTRGKINKAVHNLQDWNTRIVFNRWERLRAADLMRHFIEKEGMSPEQAADEVRNTLGSDKVTPFMQKLNRGVFMFVPWMRTVIGMSVRMGLLHPQTWNAPLQAARTERENVGDDAPVGNNPYRLSNPEYDEGGHLTGYQHIDPPLTNRVLEPIAAFALGDENAESFFDLGAHVRKPLQYLTGHFYPGPRAAMGTAFAAFGEAGSPYAYWDRNTTEDEQLRSLGDHLIGSELYPAQAAADLMRDPATVARTLMGVNVSSNRAGRSVYGNTGDYREYYKTRNRLEEKLAKAKRDGDRQTQYEIQAQIRELGEP